MAPSRKRTLSRLANTALHYGILHSLGVADVRVSEDSEIENETFRGTLWWAYSNGFLGDILTMTLERRSERRRKY